ncbi:MAG: GAF domain-containing protein, partial [Syntrophomonadaceae bacterium]|nr:GAF domain-containing protein [Syntrophomonadaceae bacterium]
MEEITERKLMEQVEALLERLDKEAFEWTLPEISCFCLQEGMKLSDSPVGFLTYSYKDKQSFISKINIGNMEADCNIDKNMLYSMMLNEETLFAEVISERKPLVINDLSSLALKTLPDGHISLQRVMVIPILHAGKVLGMIVLANKETDYSRIDMDVACVFARSGWSTIRRQQAEKARRESEARFSSVFNSVQAGIVLIDAQNRKIVDANPSAMQMYGATLDETLGKYCHETICLACSNTCPILDLGAT